IPNASAAAIPVNTIDLQRIGPSSAWRTPESLEPIVGEARRDYCHLVHTLRVTSTTLVASWLIPPRPDPGSCGRPAAGTGCRGARARPEGAACRPKAGRPAA